MDHARREKKNDWEECVAAIEEWKVRPPPALAPRPPPSRPPAAAATRASRRWIALVQSSLPPRSVVGDACAACGPAMRSCIAHRPRCPHLAATTTLT